jgi:UDP-glucose 4-epimerase
MMRLMAGCPTSAIDSRVAPYFRGKRVLVTGGLGFVGSNLAERLLFYGADVLLVDSLIPEYGGSLFNIEPFRDRVTVNIADVRDAHGMRWLVRERDYLFNLAGQTSHLDSMADPFTDLEINCRSQLFILEACRKLNPRVRMVFASTRQFYGAPAYLPVDERHPLQPTDVNGINKMAAEWYHILYHRVYGMPTTALRMTNTYGPRMRVRDARQTFLGWWFHQVLTGQEILVYGDGRQLRDFNYVDDCVDAFLLAAVDDRAIGEVFNLGASPPWSLQDVAELIVKLNGSGAFRLVPFPPERKAIDIGDYYADHGKISRTLGWAPRVALDDGVTRTLDYYRRFGPGHYWNVSP